MGFLIPWENDDHDERENSVPVRKSDDEISGECRNRDDAILIRSLSTSLISLLKPTAGNHAFCFIHTAVRDGPKTTGGVYYTIPAIGAHAS